MIRRRSLSYDEDGIIYLDEWDQAQTDEEEAEVGEGTDSTPLGHINNPRTSFNVPECLHDEHDELLIEWALLTAERLQRERTDRP